MKRTFALLLLTALAGAETRAAFESEVANRIELGSRAQPASSLNFSVTAFAHPWDRIRGGTSIPQREIYGSAGITWMEDDLRERTNVGQMRWQF